MLTPTRPRTFYTDFPDTTSCLEMNSFTTSSLFPLEMRWRVRWMNIQLLFPSEVLTSMPTFGLISCESSTISLTHCTLIDTYRYEAIMLTLHGRNWWQELG